MTVITVHNISRTFWGLKQKCVYFLLILMIKQLVLAEINGKRMIIITMHASLCKYRRFIVGWGGVGWGKEAKSLYIALILMILQLVAVIILGGKKSNMMP